MRTNPTTSRPRISTIEEKSVGRIVVNQKNLGRAGSKCWLGKRPVVRWVVMNPVDHSMGVVKGKPLELYCAWKKN
jgi:ribosomal protein L2